MKKLHLAPYRIAWTVFGLGIVLQPVAVLIWMMIVGPSWWMAYHNGGALGALANRVEYTIFGLGFILCILAPFLTAVPLRRKLALSALSVIAGGVMWFLSGLLVILIYGV